MIKTREEEVPESELNPYPRTKKKKRRNDWLTIREDTGEGRDYCFENEKESNGKTAKGD